MDKAFINKVKQTILKHLEDEKFGVNELASEIGLSKSQIWRKLKYSTGKTANEFIREVRLQEAVKLIQEDEYTASEIAYRVGFSSPSYFHKCFHDHFGITPGEFREEKEEIPISNEIFQKPIRKLDSKLFKPALFLILFIVVFTISYLLIDKTKQSSIAVLPFLDLSENKDQDYLTDGITEQITLELAKKKGIRVISRTSAMSFKGENILSSDIAKDLGVDYLLEGSILQDYDSIRVIVQLIEPFPREKHIWQNSYNQKYENILNLVKGISTEIATEINIVVNPDEIEQIEYVVNTEAYDLYLKGRHLWHQQANSSILNSIKFLKESIKLDSGFAPAYVTLAEAYIVLNKFIKDNEEKPINRVKSRKAINKALELDNKLGAAYITKGNVLGKFDWNWEEMKKMLDKGLRLDPNNAYGHMLLSDYYLVNNNFNMAINEALIAENLDPLNPMIGTSIGTKYCMTNNIEKSIEQYQKVLKVFPGYAGALDNLGFVQYLNGQKEESKKTFIKLQEVFGNYDMVKAYKENQIIEDTFRFWLSSLKEWDTKYCSHPVVVAQVYMLMNEKQEALEYLEIAYKYRFEYLPLALFRPEFNSLHSEPRFIDLVKKTGVIFPDIQQEYKIKD